MENISFTVPLHVADPGVYTVVSINGGVSLVRKLLNAGISPGTVIEVLAPPGRGPITVAVGGPRFRLGRGVSARVLLRSESRGAAGRPGVGWGRWGAVRENALTLREYKEGQKGRILEVRGEGRFRKRLLEMGFVRGAEVYVEKYAPLLDPVEYIVKGYHVSLRRDEAGKIVMGEPE